MKIDAKRRTLTTGDIAKLCGVNFRTVIRWIQRGHLKAFQLPGRGDNRVLVKDFIKFLRENNMPIPDELRSFSSVVLIIDGDAKAAKSMKRALDKAGFQTEIATDGFAAGHMVSTVLPSVVVVDPSTEGLGGLAAVKRLKSDPQLDQLKMLVLSDMTEQELAAAAKAGADDTAAKPLKNPKLVERVAELAGVDLD
ncbi:MAG: response regulator [bacterium]|nr:response regulator [bacterium]